MLCFRALAIVIERFLDLSDLCPRKNLLRWLDRYSLVGLSVSELRCSRFVYYLAVFFKSSLAGAFYLLRSLRLRRNHIWLKCRKLLASGCGLWVTDLMGGLVGPWAGCRNNILS